MKAINLRELKDCLRPYLRQIRNGEGIRTTDPGAVVMQLGQPGRAPISGAAPAGLVDLATRGFATIGAPNDSDVYPKLPPALTPGGLARLLDDERGEPFSAACG